MAATQTTSNQAALGDALARATIMACYVAVGWAGDYLAVRVTWAPLGIAWGALFGYLGWRKGFRDGETG
jgi:hypothetical protein